MRHLPTLLLAILAAAITSWLLAPSGNSPATTESAFDRVMRTGTLRCAYYVFPPVLNFDETTHQPYGLAVDMMNSIAAKTSLKVEWVEEINFGNWMPGLITKRYDAVCAPMWPNAAMTREALFSQPFMFTAIWPYARTEDTRFDKNPAKINSPATTIAVMEGNVTTDLANQLFPQAKQYAIPGNADFGLAVEAVRSHKADLVLWDTNGVFQYQQSNPNSLHQVQLATPLQVMAFAIPLNRGEYQLKSLLDAALNDMHYSGELDRLITKAEQHGGPFLRLPAPYRQ